MGDICVGWLQTQQKVGYILMGIKIQMMAYKSNSNIVTQDLSRLL